MARKSAEQEFNEGIYWDLLTSAYDSLAEGARGSGVMLTKGECAVLLGKLPILRSGGWPWWWFIAEFSFRQEAGSGSVEAAIQTTMDKFQVSRQTVYDARRQEKEYLALLRERGESN